MSEEENKAIENFNEIIKNLDEDEQIEYEEEIQDYKTLLNLIEKQQKEIEELKKPKYLVHFEDNKITKIELINDYISKDKIRELIKKYQEKAEDVKQKYKGVYAYKSDYLEALAKIEGYQELLEED